MTNFRNLKIAINYQQPLDEVVRELERLGYRYTGWYSLFVPEMFLEINTIDRGFMNTQLSGQLDGVR